MKFLLIVLFIRFLIEAILQNKSNRQLREEDELNAGARHPAEFMLR